MKAILISIKPKWVAKILNGEKTIEVRKSKPNVDLPIDVYVYCTKDKKVDTILYRPYKSLECSYRIQGKVVAKFTLNKVEEIKHDRYSEQGIYYGTHLLGEPVLEKLSCLELKEIDNYLKGKNGYAWYISNLVIFDKPEELSEFSTIVRPYNKPTYRLTKAPQSWQFIETGE